MRTPIEITELLGDGIGPELAESIATVADALPIDLKFRKIDWSLPTREAKGLVAIDEAEAAMRATRIGLKYPTVTGSRSPNALLRRRLDFSVIYRPVISIPGISSNFKENVNAHIVRIATGGTYDDPGQLIGRHAAVSLRMVEREPCLHAAHFAFRLARDKGYTVTSASKHTIQKVTDGLFEAVVDEVHDQYDKEVHHHKELFDALLGKLILRPQDYQVILVLNEYGDFLSDMASGLVGSLGTGASGNYSFDDDHNVALAMFDPAGGTAPDIAGKNKANPAAMMLAFGMLLDHIGRYDLGHALRLSLLNAIKDGCCTADLRGKMSTTEFTAEVVSRLPGHLAEIMESEDG
ncbi:MAG: isocitrate dehydrogenase [Gammaproteobacteria bacterium]|nr:isocitrate dehydrogenase [Gammaproteobacteria bacterium]